MGEASRYLVEPGEPDDSVTNGFTNPLDAFNYISPSAWVNEIIEQVCGVDLFGWATDVHRRVVRPVQVRRCVAVAGQVHAGAGDWHPGGCCPAGRVVGWKRRGRGVQLLLHARGGDQRPADGSVRGRRGLSRRGARGVAAVQPVGEPAAGRGRQGDSGRHLRRCRDRYRRDRRGRGGGVRRPLPGRRSSSSSWSTRRRPSSTPPAR